MTAIATAVALGEGAVGGMLAAMATRGGGARAHVDVDGAAIGAARLPWEDEVTPAGTGLARNDRAILVADATLYYAGELVRACTDAGVRPRDATAAELLLAAYCAFGDRCVERVEGDFAFIAWDVARQRLFAARDFSGKRTLFYGVVGSGLALASTAGGVLAAPGMRRGIDIAVLASVASGSWTHTDETAWTGVRELRAGHALVLARGAVPRTSEWWFAPMDRTDARVDLAEGAAELRRLLARATEERLAPRGTTAVSLSGAMLRATRMR